ncbi:MAG: glycerol-3-phosphate dehydrogenase [Betaproteobacteria bacterium]|nr:glycerol-3-phosphate dehydrogenase [Betaproteobacteria bacterium]
MAGCTFSFIDAPAMHDLLIIGGGINGAGIARDAAGRGLRVMLAEMGDLAGATSSASTKLIHGGLRYLEHREFRLVAEALGEREALLATAPHIVTPLTFVIPHVAEMRPAWMMRLGLLLYDHLGRRVTLPRSGAVCLSGSPMGAGLRGDLTRGFHYADGWVDDARLVVFNAIDARARGATVLTRTRVVSLRRAQGHWRATLQDGASGECREVMARAVVNAAGPWVAEVAGLAEPRPPGVRLVKGSHIVVPRVHGHPHALLLQNDDRRVVFIIPYEGRYSLIGTTDVPVAAQLCGEPITADETDYLLRAANRYLARPLVAADVVWSFSGVRPLVDDGEDDPSAVTRDYRFELSETDGLPLLSIYGGKITTYRKLAEHALERLRPWFPAQGGRWTATAALPGGDLPRGGLAAFQAELRRRLPDLDSSWLDALARRHGTLALEVLGTARQPDDLGRDFGGGLREIELEYLRRREWVCCADDVLWRRSKCGLHMSEVQRRALADVLAPQPAPCSVATG